MKFELNTHPGLIIEYPIIELQKTSDFPQIEQFQPEVILIGENYKVYHVLPAQDYIQGTWTDENVEDAINNYFNSLTV